LKALDPNRMKILTAMWYYLPSSEQWRLIFASPLVDESGPSTAYLEVQRALRKLSAQLRRALHISEISVVSPSSELPRLIRAAIQTTPDSSAPIRFKANTVNGTYVDDAIIYRST
jgi:hypothetical protein